VETLLKPENKDQLVKILTCHVVAANAMSDAINQMIADDGGMHPVKTVGGCEFTAMKDGDKIQIKDGQGNVATVTIADVKQSNGVIHVIDTVLLPATLPHPPHSSPHSGCGRGPGPSMGSSHPDPLFALSSAAMPGFIGPCGTSCS